MYSDLREEARDHARVRNAYFEQVLDCLGPKIWYYVNFSFYNNRHNDNSILIVCLQATAVAFVLQFSLHFTGIYYLL
jgi:hypothetical protein